MRDYFVLVLGVGYRLRLLQSIAKYVNTFYFSPYADLRRFASANYLRRFDLLYTNVKTDCMSRFLRWCWE